MARADAELNRRRLIFTARDAVADHGPAISVRSIADLAGISLTTLYRHFPDKQGLIDGVSVYRWAMLTRLARRCGATSNPLSAVLHLLDVFTWTVTADDTFIRTTGLRVGHTPAAIQPIRAQFDPLFAALWAGAQQRGQIRASAHPRDAMHLAATIRDQQRRTSMLLLLSNGISSGTEDTERLLCDLAPARARSRSLLEP